MRCSHPACATLLPAPGTSARLIDLSITCASCSRPLLSVTGGHLTPGLELWLGNFCPSCKRVYCKECLDDWVGFPASRAVIASTRYSISGSAIFCPGCKSVYCFDCQETFASPIYCPNCAGITLPAAPQILKEYGVIVDRPIWSSGSQYLNN